MSKFSERLLELYNQGYNTTELSKMTGICRSTVHYHIKKCHGKNLKQHKASKDELEKLRAMYLDGVKLKDIAKSFGHPYHWVVNHIYTDLKLQDRASYSHSLLTKNPRMQKLIQEAFISGMKITEIAKETGAKRERVYYYVRKNPEAQRILFSRRDIHRLTSDEGRLCGTLSHQIPYEKERERYIKAGRSMREVIELKRNLVSLKHKEEDEEKPHWTDESPLKKKKEISPVRRKVDDLIDELVEDRLKSQRPRP